MSEALKLTTFMPSLDEAETLSSCISKERAFVAPYGCADEVVIADNGSTGGSQAIAAANSRVGGDVPMFFSPAFVRARGKFVIMGDSDDGYGFNRPNAFGELGVAVYALGSWSAEQIAALVYAETMRLVCPSGESELSSSVAPGRRKKLSSRRRMDAVGEPRRCAGLPSRNG
jgi:hypothetical protein